MERVKSMKKKKVVALLCIGTLLAGMLAGCGSSSGKETENGNVKVSDSSSEVTDAIFTGELERNVTISVLELPCEWLIQKVVWRTNLVEELTELANLYYKQKQI